MALRWIVEGGQDKVREFVDSIKIIPNWRFYSGAIASTGRDELRIEYYIDEKKLLREDKKRSKLSISL